MFNNQCLTIVIERGFNHNADLTGTGGLTFVSECTIVNMPGYKSYMYNLRPSNLISLDWIR